MDIEEKYEKRLEANRRYRQAHKEVLAEKAKIFYLNNREAILERQRERNRKECGELKAYRRTLHDEVAELIAGYERKIVELKAMLPDA